MIESAFKFLDFSTGIIVRPVGIFVVVLGGMRFTGPAHGESVVAITIAQGERFGALEADRRDAFVEGDMIGETDRKSVV